MTCLLTLLQHFCSLKKADCRRKCLWFYLSDFWCEANSVEQNYLVWDRSVVSTKMARSSIFRAKLIAEETPLQPDVTTLLLGDWSGGIIAKNVKKSKTLDKVNNKLKALALKLLSIHPNTALVWFSKGRFVSGCQMVRHLNGGWKLDRKSLFMFQNVRYLNGWPSHVTLLFEYQTPILFSIQVFRWLL